jgi:membrane protein implicated in regulation of membrane protease activity
MWLLVAFALLGAEMFTGSFYLLMLALGAASAALAAMAGADAGLQMTAAALVGGGATAAWHIWRKRHPREQPASHNPAVLLDIGQTVQVQLWRDDGSTQVQYRGCAWTARLQSHQPRQTGPHQIVAIHGNVLEIRPAHVSP